jgi:hypothetical protein
MPASFKADKFCSGLSVFFLLLGVFSRIFIYAKGQDLWLDEALLLEKIGGSDYSEFTLRFLPLLAGMAALFLGYIFALREFGARFACIFLFLLVSSDTLLFYSVNFSVYGFEALLMVIGLCVWSFSKKNEPVLILSVSAISIFCIACNSGGADWISLWEFFQMLGRHFINFHYFVFGKLVWLNAIIFILLFSFGSIFLYREKRSLLIAIFAAIFIFALLYLLKITPLGVPYSKLMRTMQNWSQMQVVGSKYLAFILPLVFIPVAFLIHKVFLKIGKRTLVFVFCILAFLALSSNSIRIHKGIGSPESTILLQSINENATAKSLIFADSASRPIFEYYIRRINPNLNYFYIKNDGYMYLNDSIFIGKHSGNIEELFDVMKNFKAENGFFYFTYSSWNSVSKSNELIGYVQRNYFGKSKGFQARQAGAAWVRF